VRLLRGLTMRLGAAPEGAGGLSCRVTHAWVCDHQYLDQDPQGRVADVFEMFTRLRWV
jgi:hypothetical protein